MNSTIEISPEAQYVLNFINQTNRNIFLTGKAGTGKTTLLKEIIQTTYKQTVVVAPTGIAALNAGGVTIHSMFQLPFAGFIPVDMDAPHVSDYFTFETKRTLGRHFKMNAIKKNVIRSMELLIIDEVSMLRPDILDATDFMLQRIRRKNKPFGGVQVLFIGDLLQLPPIVKPDEWSVLSQYYKGKYFFHSHTTTSFPPLYIELSKIFRQEDPTFINILNHLRNNILTDEDVDTLNNYYDPTFDVTSNSGHIILTTHNAKADAINRESLLEISKKSFYYDAEIVGEFSDKMYPLDSKLELRVGAQVMFIKNDLNLEKRYYNGKIGTIDSLSEQEIIVYLSEEDKYITVDKYEWENIRYFIDDLTKEVKEEILGTFTQYPLKLAWAITIHKSQGLTFDKAILDISKVFESGQAYVAFSRLRSLKGLILLSMVQKVGFNNDKDVLEYSNLKAEANTLESELLRETKLFTKQYLKDSFNFESLNKEWYYHKSSYLQDSDITIKTKSKSWATEQYNLCATMKDSSQKFQIQIDQLFYSEPLDVKYIESRIEAAYNYYFKILDTLCFNILLKLEQVMRAKRAKQYYNELKELEESHISAVLKIMKSKQMMSSLVASKSLNKSNLLTPEQSTYKSKLLVRVKNAYESEYADLIEEGTLANRYEAKSKSKEPKISTFEQTFALWNEFKDISKIVEMRKLTENTILGHFGKLIEEQKMKLSDVLEPKIIKQLGSTFHDISPSMTLNDMKALAGDTFDWGQVKLYKSHLIAINT